MQEEGFANMVTDLLKEAMGEVSLELKDMFKGVRPFRKPIIPDREKLFTYESIAPEVKAQFQQADPQGFMALEEEMSKLRRKFNA